MVEFVIGVFVGVLSVVVYALSSDNKVSRYD